MTVSGDNADSGKAEELKLRSSVRCLLLTDILGREHRRTPNMPCENITSSTKPELHNELQCFQRRTGPRPQVTRTENLVKFGHTAFKVRERTDRQTYRHADRNTSHTWRGEVKIGNETPLGTLLGWGYSVVPRQSVMPFTSYSCSLYARVDFYWTTLAVGGRCSTTLYYDLQQIFCIFNSHCLTC